MNKIFKVVWSKVRNCYVVVSEIAKNTVSGVGKRNRIKRVSLAATLAASVLTSGFFLSNEAWAAESALVDAQKYNYIAIGGASSTSNPFVGSTTVEVSDIVDGKITIKYNKGTDDTSDDESYVYRFTEVQYTSNGETETKYYWIREGFGVKAITERYHPNATDIRLDLYKIPGEKASYDYIAMTGEHAAEITDKVTPVNRVNLDSLTYIQYAGMTNAGGTQVPNDWNYYVKRGEEYIDVGGGNGNLEKNFYVFKSTEYNEKTGKYTFNGQDVDYDDVYKVGNQIGVFLTGSYNGAYNDSSLLSGQIAQNGIGVYGGTVYGLNNEILLSGYDSKTDTWSTVWAGEVTDPNATIQSMTLNEFNEILHHLHEEDVKLLDADIVRAKVTPNVDTGVNTTLGSGSVITGGGSVNLVNVAGNQVPGLLIQSSGGTDGDDTVITIMDSNPVYNDDGTVSQGNRSSIRLETGSKVVANNGAAYNEGDSLTSLSINGNVYTVSTSGGTTTTTSANISLIEGENVDIVGTGTNEDGDKTYTISAKNTTYRIESDDRDTSGQKVYSIYSNESTNNLVGQIIDTDTNTTYYIENQGVDSNGTTSYVLKNSSDTGISLITDTNTTTENVALNFNTDSKQLTVSLVDSNNVTKTSNVVDLSSLLSGTTSSGDSVIDKHLVGTGEDKKGAYTVVGGSVTLDVENGDDVTITGIASTTDVLNLETKVNSGWVAKINGVDVKHIIPSDNALNFVSGKNVKLSKDENSNLIISANDYRLVGAAVTSNEENAATTYDGNYTVDSTGEVRLNVQNNVDDSIANVIIGNIASKSDLDALKATAESANKGWNLQVGDGNAYDVLPDSTVTLQSNDTNLTINRNDGTVTFDFSDTPDFTSVSIGSGNKVIIDNNGINMNNRKIAGLANGTQNGDAVHFGQLPIVSAGANVTVTSTNDEATGKTTYTVSVADDKYVSEVTYNNNTLTIQRSDGTTLLTQDLSGITSGLSSTDHRLVKNTTTTDGAYKVTDTGEVELIVQNPNGTTDENSNVKITGIASKEALETVKNNVDTGWNLKAGDNDSSGYNVTPQNKNVALKSADTNLIISRTDGTVTFDFSDTPNFISVSVGNNNDMVIVNSDGINMGGNKISNLAAGIADADAVNLAQLKAARTEVVSGKNTTVTSGANTDTNQVTYTVNADKTTVSTSDSNITLTSTTNADEFLTNYDIDLKDNITLGSDSSKQINIDGTSGKVKVGGVIEVNTTGIGMGNQKITGLAAGTADTDAVNVKQLQDYVANNDKDTNTVTTINQGTNGSVTVSESTDSAGNKTYTISGVDTNNYTTGVTASVDGQNSKKINTTYTRNNSETFNGISFVAGTNVDLSVDKGCCVNGWYRL